MGPNPNGPLSKVLEILDTQVLGVRSVGPVGDFLDSGENSLLNFRTRTQLAGASQPSPDAGSSTTVEVQ